MDRSSKQKINKETQALNGTLDEIDLIDIFRTSHPNAEEYIFFSSAHGTFSRTDHILGHKSNLSKFKKTEIISRIYSDHNTVRPDINYKKTIIRNTGLQEAQAGIKTARRNINNLRYADDTTPMAESEELKRLLMKVKEES